MACSNCFPPFTALQKLKDCKLIHISKFRSSQPLTAFERNQLDGLILHGEKELFEYDEAIARLKEIIVGLENDKVNLKQKVHLAKSFMAPVRKLHPEILGQIFIAHAVTNKISPKGCVVPGLTIASVCSQWRSIAQGTTALWNNISLRWSEDSEHQWHPRHVSLVKKLLKLSQTSLLSIDINSPAGSSLVVPPCLPLLCKHAARWQRLNGFSFCDAILDTLSSLCGRFDNLHTFNFRCPFERCNTLLKHAPKLTTLNVSSMYTIDSEVSIPWNQIIHLVFRFSDSCDILQSLAASPNLQTLRTSYIRAGGDIHRQRLMHASLTKLDIGLGNKNTDEITNFLHLLHLPKLQQLSITSRIGKSSDTSWQLSFPWSGIKLTSFLSRSSLITTFHLEGIWIGTTDLIILLHRMSNLESLSLSEVSTENFTNLKAPPTLNDEFLKKLSGHAHELLLPHLKNLSLEVHSLHSFNVNVFVDMIHSRWRPSRVEGGGEVAGIRVANLKVREDRIDPALVHSLAILEKRGLVVGIKDKHGDVLALARRSLNDSVTVYT